MVLPKKPIVIVGCQRSGTTLLRAMLSGNSHLLVHPDEPQFILELYERHGHSIRDVHGALAHMTSHPLFPQDLSPESLLSACGSDNTISLKSLVECYLYAWRGDSLEGRRLVLKHPRLIFHLALVHNLFPDVHVVHILRDPRATVSSQISRWPRMSIWEAASLWRRAVRAGRRWAELGRTPYTEIRYEQLVLEPERSLTELCQSLDIRFTPQMLEFELHQRAFARNAAPEPIQFTSPDQSRLHLWKERLSPEEVWLVENCCGQEMKWWGYTLLNPTVSLGRIGVRYARERLGYVLLVLGRRLKNLCRRVAWRLGTAR